MQIILALFYKTLLTTAYPSANLFIMPNQNNNKISINNALSIKEAAEALKVHFTTIYRWINDGKIVTLEFGGSIYIPNVEIERINKMKGNYADIPGRK